MQLMEYIDKRREMARYRTMKVRFDGFLRADGLSGGGVRLDCTIKRPGDMIRGYAPAYFFDIVAECGKVGAISLRVGYSKSLYFSGQIGYAVDGPHRGNGYAGKACELLIPLMLAHGMTKVLITNNRDNLASRRVCEKLGARLLRVAKIPRWHEMYDSGERYKNIFEWDVGAAADAAGVTAI